MAAAAALALARTPHERGGYTWADAMEWDEDVRAEILEGKLYMLAAPLRIHQEVLLSIADQLYQFLKGKPCTVYVAPFAVRLFEKKQDRPENVDTVVEPDIVVVCDRDKLDWYGCRGAPDMVVEILSPVNRAHDRRRKYRLYEKAGVREYWIVNPELRSVMVHTLSEGKYDSPDEYIARAVIPVSVLEGCTVNLAAVFPGEAEEA